MQAPRAAAMLGAMKRLALILTLAATPACATPEYRLPTLFDVTGVAADDRLNIRAEPSASAPIIGTLAPDATRIEVTEEQRGWARVNTAEQAGWVAARFLAYRTDVWAPGALPPALACLGTEPFWSLRLEGDALVFSTPEANERSQTITAILDSGGFRDPMRAVEAGDFTLVATPGQCSDSMSDRLYGLAASLVQRGPQPRLWTGCCTIQPRQP